MRQAERRPFTIYAAGQHEPQLLALARRQGERIVQLAGDATTLQRRGIGDDAAVLLAPGAVERAGALVAPEIGVRGGIVGRSITQHRRRPVWGQAIVGDDGAALLI